MISHTQLNLLFPFLALLYETKLVMFCICWLCSMHAAFAAPSRGEPETLAPPYTFRFAFLPWFTVPPYFPACCIRAVSPSAECCTVTHTVVFHSVAPGTS